VSRIARVRSQNKEDRYSRVPDCQIPVTQLKGPKGDWDIQAAKRECSVPLTSVHTDRRTRLYRLG